MKNLKFKFHAFGVVLFSLFIANYSLLTGEVSAHCPLCVGGAAIGLSVARFFGIDDSITGLWIAALLGALSFWSDSYLNRKFKFSLMRPLVYIGIFALTIWSFYAFNDYLISKFQFYLINKHAGNILGIDKLTFGVLVGGILFYLVDAIDTLLIKRNGKVYFPYQRVVVSLGVILITSLVFYVLVNYYI